MRENKEKHIKTARFLLVNFDTQKKNAIFEPIKTNNTYGL